MNYQSQKPSILITGSSGLIGQPLVKSCQELGFAVKLFDIKNSKASSGFGDILNKDQLKKAIENCSGVVHLAAVSRVIWGERDPDLCIKTNILGTKNVIDTTLETEPKPWILYASSREVYGEAKNFPVEEDAPLRPVNIYGKSKAQAEELILNARNKGLITAILRFSNVFGSPFDHVDRVVPAFCRAALQDEPLRLEGWENTFDFTYINDVIDGIIKAIQLLMKGELINPIHLTTNRATNLKQLSEIVSSAANKKLKITHAPSRNFDVSYFVGSTKNAKEILTWSPKTSLESGIKNLVLDLKKQLT